MVAYVWNGNVNPFTPPYPLKAYRGSTANTTIRINAGTIDCTGSNNGDILLDENRVAGKGIVRVLGLPSSSMIRYLTSGPCIVDSFGNGIYLYRNQGTLGNSFQIKKIVGYVVNNQSNGILANNIPDTIYTNGANKFAMGIDNADRTVKVYSGVSTIPAYTYTFEQLTLSSFMNTTAFRFGVIIKGITNTRTQLRFFEVQAALSRNLFTKTAAKILLTQILQANPKLTINKVVLANTNTGSGLKNSATQVNARPNTGYSGNTVIQHNRANLADLSRFGPTNILMSSGDVFTSLLVKLNEKYGMLLAIDDVVNQTLPVISDTTKQATFVLTGAPNSKGFYGNLSLTLIKE